jgi:hypothetical protein
MGEMTKTRQKHSCRVIQLIECNHDPVCCGFRWLIENEDALAQLVAWTMQGHYRHAERVLKSLDAPVLPRRLTIQQQAIRRLNLPKSSKKEVYRYHRDGLVFQHIAWIAAIIGGEQHIAASMPHLITAHKGFDAILVPLDGVGNALTGIIICEEKATINPRHQITQEVWPSIASIESGERDAEINAELSAILDRYNVQNIDQILTEAHWLGHKTYRVSITIAAEHDANHARSALFDGFESKAPGEITRRRAETLMLTDLRNWMDAFCSKVVTHIQGA